MQPVNQPLAYSIYEAYLRESHVSSALQDALLSLFSLPILPGAGALLIWSIQPIYCSNMQGRRHFVAENPYYYLAEFLLAYNDLSRPHLVSDLIDDLLAGNATLEDPSKSICKCADFAFGLPHIILFCTHSGIRGTLVA